MNRRSFFNSLSSAVAGIYLACHVYLSVASGMVVEAEAPKLTYVVNPEWVDAPYEIAFLMDGSPGPTNFPSFTQFDRKEYRGGYPGNISSEPVRVDCDGHLVPKYISIGKL